MILPYKGALVIGALAGFLVLERLFPMARLVHGLRQIGRNLSLAGINAVLSWLVVVPVSAFAAQWALDWRPAMVGRLDGAGSRSPHPRLLDLLVAPRQSRDPLPLALP